MPLLDDKSLTQDRTREWVAEPGLVPALDLDRHTLCGVALGEPFERLRGLGAAEGGTFGADGDYAYFSRGLRVELSKGRCETFQLYLVGEEGFVPFIGRCVHQGRDVSLDGLVTESELTARFGPPYWRDEDEDGERLLFYEHPRAGTEGWIEWQLELDDAGRLTCLILTASPTLAGAEQREAYGVTKPWPP